MERGILQIETDYSNTDFKIEWDQIQAIRTSTSFFITQSNEKIYYGALETSTASKVSILAGDKKVTECNLDEIVYLQQLKTGFWDRLYASIDIGISLAKANDLRQMTSRSTIGYRTEKQRFRADFNLDIKYEFPYDFYIKIGLTVNYDNKPAEGASETDYVLQTGLGWEW